MPLPISKHQLNRLGERIASSETPSKEDLQRLNEVLRAYQAILVTVEEQLALIGLAATSRVKTRSVLIEKLQRERGMALARVQDMAGARTVITGGWAEQDAIVQRLTTHFDAWASKPSRIIDRRVSPSHGYRAVHVIVFPENVPVEIQVRTELQNYWAQIVERLADRWGRSVRYGGDPQDAQLPAEGIAYPDGSPITRQRIVYDLREVIAKQIAEIEQIEVLTKALKDASATTLEDRMAKALGCDVVDLQVDPALYYHKLRTSFKRLVTTLVSAGALEVAHGNARAGLRVRDRRHAGRIVRRALPDVSSPGVDFVRQKYLQSEAFVDGILDTHQSRRRQRQDILRAGLRKLGQYVEQGGIR